MNRHGKLWSMWALVAALLWIGACQPAAKHVAKQADDSADAKNDQPAASPVGEAPSAAEPKADMPPEEKVAAKTPAAEPPATEASSKPQPPAADAEKTPAEKPAAEAKPAAAETKTPAAKPAPVEAKPADAKPADAKPADTKPAEVKPADGEAEKVVLGSADLTAGIPGNGPLKLEDIRKWLADPKNTAVLEFTLPLGLSAGIQQVKGLEANPLTRAKIELGRQLYFDPRLSADKTVSCASCHHPDTGWAARTQFGVGIKGQTGGRNSPVSFNRILSDLQFWDGRAASLEAQAVGPIANPIEMGNTHEAVVDSLKKIPGYQAEFEKTYGGISIDAVGAAIASFERSIVTGPSPYDYYDRFRPLQNMDPADLKDEDPALYAKYVEFKKAVDEHPMSDSAKRGRELFFSDKTNCTACHVGPNFTDEKFHNLGVGMDKPEPDLGREAITHDPKDRGAFKTPTIRNAAVSGPYMHDGSQKTLEEVVEFYAKGGHPNPSLDEKVKKLNLTDQDKKDLVEFIKACTGDFPKIERDRLPE